MLPNIYLDADGVLVDYTNAFLKFSGLADKGFTYTDVVDYDLSKMFPRGKEQECWGIMKVFSESREFHSLKPIVNITSLEALKNLGYPVCMVSQISSHKARLSRIHNLTRLFGNVFDNMLFTSHGQSKLDLIYKVTDRTENIILEDNPSVFDVIREKNGVFGDVNIRGICIEHPYNSSITPYKDVVAVAQDTDSAIALLVEQYIEMQHNEAKRILK